MYDEYSYRILMRLREVKAARFKDFRLIVGNPRMLTLKLRKLMRWLRSILKLAPNSYHKSTI
ncbi:MAG: hypothetical protein LM601_06440 [Candidatus Verstraetearchaeota archaeon]|jgi:DNA-binding HxlR family transcriptional regulator|nr:hypothetical protein [Candidatus Verstraetearchaeota archaeon]